MEVKITGKIPINVDDSVQKSLSSFVEDNFPDLMNLSQGILYISGFIDLKEMDKVEKFLLKIHSIVDCSQSPTLKVKNDLMELIRVYTISEDQIILSIRKDFSAEYIETTVTIQP